MSKIFVGGGWLDLEPQLTADVNQLKTSVANKLDTSSVLRMVPTANSVRQDLAFQYTLSTETWIFTGTYSTPASLDVTNASHIRVCMYRASTYPKCYNDHVFAINASYLGYTFILRNTSGEVCKLSKKHSTSHLLDEVGPFNPVTYIFDDYIPIPKKLDATTADSMQVEYPASAELLPEFWLSKMKFVYKNYSASMWEDQAKLTAIGITFTPYRLSVSDGRHTDSTPIPTTW